MTDRRAYSPPPAKYFIASLQTGARSQQLWLQTSPQPWVRAGNAAGGTVQPPATSHAMGGDGHRVSPLPAAHAKQPPVLCGELEVLHGCGAAGSLRYWQQCSAAGLERLSRTELCGLARSTPLSSLPTLPALPPPAPTTHRDWTAWCHMAERNQDKKIELDLGVVERVARARWEKFAERWHRHSLAALSQCREDGQTDTPGLQPPRDTCGGEHKLRSILSPPRQPCPWW